GLKHQQSSVAARSTLCIKPQGGCIKRTRLQTLIDKKYDRYMKILVTGAAGFIGFHLGKRLIREGHQVIGLDNINDYYSTDLKYDRLAELGIPTEEIVEGELVESRK